MKLLGKRIAITGGSGGIGSHLVRLIVEEGGSPILVNRTKTNASGNYIEGDLSTREGIAKVAAALAAHKPDILINLAGIQYFGFFQNQSTDQVELLYHTNLIAPALLAQAVIPGMRSRGSGQIVNIGSVFGAIPFAHFVAYSSAKAGLKAFSQGLRRELTGTGITVTHISPRAVKTKLNDERILKLASRTKMVMDDPEQVARKILNAIIYEKKDVVIGSQENVFVKVNALLPGLVDKALAKNDLIAREILSA